MLLIFICVIFLLDATNAAVPLYYVEELCGSTIQVGSSSISQAAHLKYLPRPGFGQRWCNVTIETNPDRTHENFHLAYAFLDSDAQNTYQCTSKIYANNGEKVKMFCGLNVYPKNTFITHKNTLLLSVDDDGQFDFTFEILLLSIKNTTCRSYETRCYGLLGDPGAGSACVDYSLACHDMYTFCESSSGRCGDIVKTNEVDSTLIVVIVITLVVVFVVAVGCFICYKKNVCGFLKMSSEERQIRAEAMNVFSLQLANRGIDGNENAAYLDEDGNPIEIDFSKFDPPPAYGSWEHLDTVGREETDGGPSSGATAADDNASPPENLPSYNDVMENFDSYSVSTQI